MPSFYHHPSALASVILHKSALSRHRTCLLWHTAVSRRVIDPGTLVPTATLFSLLVRYPDNSSAPLCGFGLAPLSIPRSRPRTFQYFLALLFYVLRFEWLPTPDSALPTGVVRHGGTMVSADSRQTVCSAALKRKGQRNRCPYKCACIAHEPSPKTSSIVVVI